VVLSCNNYSRCIIIRLIFLLFIVQPSYRWNIHNCIFGHATFLIQHLISCLSHYSCCLDTLKFAIVFDEMLHGLLVHVGMRVLLIGWILTHVVHRVKSFAIFRKKKIVRLKLTAHLTKFDPSSIYAVGNPCGPCLPKNKKRLIVSPNPVRPCLAGGPWVFMRCVGGWR
jgi:hypothetical protein